jgi:hypothetical protein
LNDTLNPLLAERLALAAQDLRSQAPPATLLPAIQRALERRKPAAASGRRATHWWGWGGLSTACAVLAVWLVVSPLPDPAPSQPLSGFVPVAGADSWRQAAQADSGSVWLVSTEIPHSRLAAMGLPYDPARAGERVRAQLLMQSSGDVLAVRIVH